MLALKNSEEKLNLPLFINHESARYWFKERFGNRFVMVDSNIENNIKFYTYHLVHDRMTYVKTMNAIREGSPFLQVDFENSFTELEISEEGFVFPKNKGRSL